MCDSDICHLYELLLLLLRGPGASWGYSPTPRSSTVGLSTQRWACSILPSRWMAALAGRLLATARFVLDCRFCKAAPICLARARASGVSPLPLRKHGAGGGRVCGP